MPLPSLHISGDNARAWNVTRAALYGAAVGAVAASFKVFGPGHQPHAAVAIVREFAGAALAFALLCAGASALRNVIARRLIWPEIR
jgi:hypothetical protein